MSNRLVLSDITVEYEQFMQQFNAYLRTRDVWKGELVVSTSQTLIGLISTVGVHAQASILRAREDAFAETSQSDDSIRSLASMQGLRMTRKLPARIENVELVSDFDVALPPYTQMHVGGQPYFAREQLLFTAGTPVITDLFQGEVQFVSIRCNGSDHQQFVAEEDHFVVSDRDTMVRINGESLERSNGVLWNFRGQPAFADLTLPDGRLLIQFGTETFGSVPQVNDQVIISYVVTQGASGNARALAGKRITIDGFPFINGRATQNPHGGADQKPVVVYKNVASGSFGTNESAVTRSHYLAAVTSYPGILDAVTLAQREINPMSLPLMNTFRVAALTNTEWSQQQVKEYFAYLRKVTMYSGEFIWTPPIPVDRDIVMTVYVFNTVIPSQVQANTERAITKMFEPQPNLLMTNFYLSDLDTLTKKSSPGKVSYVEFESPVGGMVVTAPNAADLFYEVVGGPGNMDAGVYGYSVAVTNDLEDGFPNEWVHPQIQNGTDNAINLRWRSVPGAVSYRLYGRRSEQGFGLIATIPANASQEFMEFFDDGSIVPTGFVPSTLNSVKIRYNRLRSLTVKVAFANRQQQMDGTPQRLSR